MFISVNRFNYISLENNTQTSNNNNSIDNNTNNDTSKNNNDINVMDTPAQNIPKPPPIFVRGVRDISTVRNELINMIGSENFFFKASLSSLKIQTHTFHFNGNSP